MFCWYSWLSRLEEEKMSKGAKKEKKKAGKKGALWWWSHDQPINPDTPYLLQEFLFPSLPNLVCFVHVSAALGLAKDKSETVTASGENVEKSR